MKALQKILLTLAMAMPIVACAKTMETQKNETNKNEQETTIPEAMKINIEVNDHNLTATLVDNSSTAALINLMKNDAVTIEMSDYSNFEKVGNLPLTLPSNDVRINTEPGDIMLYQSNQMVIFYGSNSWEYTRLGKIDNISQTELKQILGTGDITVKLTCGSN